MASRDAGDAMDLGQTMIVAGIGCRKGISIGEVDAAIAAALIQSGLDRDQLNLIATASFKCNEAGIVGAAKARALSLRLVTHVELESVNDRLLTRSAQVLALKELNSVAEAAALVAAGPNARLLAARIVLGSVTCALAKGEDLP